MQRRLVAKLSSFLITTLRLSVFA